MGLDYHNEVKNNFDIKIIINASLAQVRFDRGGPLDKRPVMHPHNQSTRRGFFFQNFLITSCILNYLWREIRNFVNWPNYGLVFENFLATNKSKNDEIVLIRCWSNSMLISKHVSCLLLLKDPYLHSLLLTPINVLHIVGLHIIVAITLFQVCNLLT